MSQNSTNAVLLIDKPAGWTSHDVVAVIRKQLNTSKKVGHTGTLDPFATGLLIIAIGPATRLIEYTHSWRKTYEATFTFGATSTTDDRTGVITATPAAVAPSVADIQKVVDSYTGEQTQLPPIYSAVKVKGKKLYEYARAGLPAVAWAKVGERARRITIHDIQIVNYEYPQVSLKIVCSTGTYIRSVARDIGQTLGIGAYVSQLRRTTIGPFHTNQAKQIDKLSTPPLLTDFLPLQSLISHLPRLSLSQENVAQLKEGKRVDMKQSSLPVDTPLVLLSPTQEVIGIGKIDSSTFLLHPKKIIDT